MTEAQDVGIQTSYSMATPTATAHEPLYLEFRIQNGSARTVTVNLGQDRKQAFVFDVVFPDGTAVSDLSMPTKEGISRRATVALSANESYVQTLLVNEWIDLSAPGTYEIEVTLMSPIVSDLGRNLSPPFRAVVTILPRDEFRLTQTCQTLTDRIAAAQSVEAAMDAALALSYVRDPIAVPFLTRALQSGKYVDHHIIRGLERVGNTSAATSLISYCKLSNGL
jgi:hypothetical protein